MSLQRLDPEKRKSGMTSYELVDGREYMSEKQKRIMMHDKVASDSVKFRKKFMQKYMSHGSFQNSKMFKKI